MQRNPTVITNDNNKTLTELEYMRPLLKYEIRYKLINHTMTS